MEKLITDTIDVFTRFFKTTYALFSVKESSLKGLFSQKESDNSYLKSNVYLVLSLLLFSIFVFPLKQIGLNLKNIFEFFIYGDVFNNSFEHFILTFLPLIGLIFLINWLLSRIAGKSTAGFNSSTLLRMLNYYIGFTLMYSVAFLLIIVLLLYLYAYVNKSNYNEKEFSFSKINTIEILFFTFVFAAFLYLLIRLLLRASHSFETRIKIKIVVTFLLDSVALGAIFWFSIVSKPLSTVESGLLVNFYKDRNVPTLLVIRKNDSLELSIDCLLENKTKSILPLIPGDSIMHLKWTETPEEKETKIWLKSSTDKGSMLIKPGDLVFVKAKATVPVSYSSLLNTNNAIEGFQIHLTPVVKARFENAYRCFNGKIRLLKNF